MNLNEINAAPLYPVTIPSSKKVTKFRPFLVKEERALLAAQESGDAVVMLNTLIQVVRACLQSEVKLLTNYDFEYLFAQIRAKSVEEIARPTIQCGHCNQSTPIEIDVRQVSVNFSDKHLKNIKLSEKLSLGMRDLSVEDLIEIEADPTLDARYEIIIRSIEIIPGNERSIRGRSD
jgi:hypothetical protein